MARAQSQATTNSTSRSAPERGRSEDRSASTAGFVDRRPSAVAQRALSKAAETSPAGMQHRSLRNAVSASPAVMQQRSFLEMVAGSPRVLQRKAFADAVPASPFVGQQREQMSGARGSAGASSNSAGTGGVSPLQRKEAGKSTPSRVVQRFGGNLGVPGNRTYPANTYLTHGSSVETFLDPLQQPQPAPDPPAWFAVGSRFSAHAGSRGGDAETHLHNYSTTGALALVAFDDVADLSAYLVNNGHAATQVNGVAEANLVSALNPGAAGYLLDRDVVRNELEIILFAPGIALLQHQFTSSLQTVEEPTYGDDSDIGRKRKLVGGGKTLHVGNPDDLSDFKTVGDVGNRRRGQSF